MDAIIASDNLEFVKRDIINIQEGKYLTTKQRRSYAVGGSPECIQCCLLAIIY